MSNAESRKWFNVIFTNQKYVSNHGEQMFIVLSCYKKDFKRFFHNRAWLSLQINIHIMDISSSFLLRARKQNFKFSLEQNRFID